MGVALVIFVLATVAVIVMWRMTFRDRQKKVESTTVKTAAVSDKSGLWVPLTKTRRAIADKFVSLAESRTMDDEYWSRLEDLLITADVGALSAAALVSAVKDSGPASFEQARIELHRVLVAFFQERRRDIKLDRNPAVILVVGVNGGGKTTSIAKLAAMLKSANRSVLLGAADTYRAAATQQLQVWADRLEVDLVSGQIGADPASVAFDSYQAARARGVDVLIVDTAGRLQNKVNLMFELGKVARVLRREAGEIDEALLVIDGSTGQNGLSQASVFTEAAGVTGIVITKLDGTARGGVAVAIERELGIPVKYIGIGEGLDDFASFHPEGFVSAMLGV